MTTRAPTLIAAEPYTLDGWAEVHGMDTWLDHLESVLIAIGQRRMTADQTDRFARLVNDAQNAALSRAKVRDLRRAG